jgi:hypothetical protein
VDGIEDLNSNIVVGVDGDSTLVRLAQVAVATSSHANSGDQWRGRVSFSDYHRPIYFNTTKYSSFQVHSTSPHTRPAH